MRVARIVFAIAFAAFAVASWAKYAGSSRPQLSFAERWVPVDAASHSGSFASSKAERAAAVVRNVDTHFIC